MSSGNFAGQYVVRFDSKHRVIVPLKLRETRDPEHPLLSTLYLTYGAEGCIAAYARDGWDRLMDEIGAGQALADEDMRIVQRLVAANADIRECDVQGRITISDKLRDYAGLTRDVVWVGVGGHAEIWDKDRWTEFEKKHISQLEQKISIVSRFGMALPQKPVDQRPGPSGPSS